MIVPAGLAATFIANEEDIVSAADTSRGRNGRRAGTMRASTPTPPCARGQQAESRAPGARQGARAADGGAGAGGGGCRLRGSVSPSSS